MAGSNSGPPQDGRDWITTQEAMGLMGFQNGSFLRAAKREQMTCRQTKGGRTFYFLRAEIEDWASFRRLRRDWYKRHNPAPGRRHTERVDPAWAAGIFITAKEAARRLGIARSTLSMMVRRGRVVSWQGIPGRAGSRLWFSPTEIERLRTDEKRRERREKCFTLPTRREHAPDASDWTNQRSSEGPLRVLEKAGRAGELMTAAQAAARLGVHENTIYALRRRGRLPGERIGRGDRFLKYWYFYPCDVEELAASEAYQERRERTRKAQQPRPIPPPVRPDPLRPQITPHITETGFGEFVFETRYAPGLW